MTTITAKDAQGLSYQELKDLLEKKKEAEIDKVRKELIHAEGIVASLKAQLSNLGVRAPATSVFAPGKRGRRKNDSFTTTSKKTKKSKGSRIPVKATVLAYLLQHGKGTPSEIVKAHPELKVLSVGQCLIGMVKAKEVTKKQKRGAPYILKK